MDEHWVLSAVTIDVRKLAKSVSMERNLWELLINGVHEHPHVSLYKDNLREKNAIFSFGKEI